MGEEPTLKNCPFCGGAARMELTKKFRGSGGFLGLVIFVEHEPDCIIHEQDEFCHGFIDFDAESEVGKSVIHGLERDFAKRWNRRAGA